MSDETCIILGTVPEIWIETPAQADGTQDETEMNHDTSCTGDTKSQNKNFFLLAP